MTRSSALSVHDSKVAMCESSKKSKPRIYGPREADKTSSTEVCGPSALSAHSQEESGLGWAGLQERIGACSAPATASGSLMVVPNRVVVVS